MDWASCKHMTGNAGEGLVNVEQRGGFLKDHFGGSGERRVNSSLVVSSGGQSEQSHWSEHSWRLTGRFLS